MHGMRCELYTISWVTDVQSRQSNSPNKPKHFYSENYEHDLNVLIRTMNICDDYFSLKFSA